jgi:hypothetical protein
LKIFALPKVRRDNVSAVEGLFSACASTTLSTETGKKDMTVIQTFEHNGKVLQLITYESAPPKPTKSIRAPGAGKFEIGQINLSDEFTLTAQITGKNIAYIYTEILLKDKNLNQFYGPIAREYIQADRDKETGGISRPDWDDTINLAVTLRPSLTLLTDGVDSAFGFCIPEGYRNPNYRLDGLYAPADGTAPRRARITFDSNGETKEIVVFKEQGRRSTPHALTPKQDDQFAPFVQILTQPARAAENGKWEATTALSTPLTFRQQPLQLITEYPMPAEYLVGILVQDLDGGFTRKYVPLTIR